MKIYSAEEYPQGTRKWHDIRAGIPTASCFDSIFQPSLSNEYWCEPCGVQYERKRKACEKCKAEVTRRKRLKPSASAEKYMHWLLAEWWLGHALDTKETYEMQRGRELEPEAVLAYEFEHDATAETVGFVTTDDGLIGASPDRLIGEDGLLEIKCPMAPGHIGYLLSGGVEDEYWAQLQGQLWVTERKWVDIQSYFPGLPTKVIRVERDEEYIGLMSGMVRGFVARMLEARSKLDARYGPFTRPAPKPAKTCEQLRAELIEAGKHGPGENWRPTF